MKFVHIADMHFDSPFTSLGRIEGLSDIRRLEQRKIFKKIIEYIQENNIECLFISGDLYENNYVKQSTIEYINNLFKTIPNTKIFIAPGNHDPYLINSYYMKFNWNNNVHIFKYDIEKIELDDVNIYGYGFSSFYSERINVNEIKIDNQKNNILIMHADLDASKEAKELYNPVATRDLLRFDYVALGHIHKPKYDNKIVYPGSPISFGFDELGAHGFISGEIKNKEIKIEFIPIDEREFKEINYDISDINSKEELIENINELEIKEDEYVELLLIGNRNFEIDKYTILKYIDNQRIIKIKDQTEIAYDLEKLSNTTTLKGLFVKKMLEKSQNKKTDH